jgi:hypothetical protein
MINIITFQSILTNNNFGNKLLNKINYSDNLNNFIKKIFIKLNLPSEYFINSLYYLHELVKIDINNLEKILNNKKLFIFSSIILNYKIFNDVPININYICEIFNINFNDFINTEIYIVNNLKWKLFINKEKINKFKKYLEHYKDLDHNLY